MELLRLLSSHHARLQVFTQHTHIVAVKPTGNVYCYEVGYSNLTCMKPWECC